MVVNRPRRAAQVALAGAFALAFMAMATPASAETRQDRQWYFKYLNVPEAQRVTAGEGVTVAVIDSGVDAHHADLVGSVLPGTSIGAERGKPATQDSDGHGTRMAGDIAGQGNGSDPTLGVAPGAKILPIRIGDENTPADISQGIRWATDHGANVINISVGANGTPPVDEKQAVRYALLHNVVVVAAAGNTNQGFTDVATPAGIAGVISVTGLDRNGQIWKYSVQGKATVLCAPAVDIISPTPKSVVSTGYSIGSGTSDAAAIVSGVVALVRAEYPGMDAANVINRLIRTSDDAGAPGHDTAYGFGIVDPVKALTAEVAPVKESPIGIPSAAAEPTEQATERGSVAAVGSSSGGGDGLLVGVLAGAGVLVLAIVGVVVGLVVYNNRRTRSALAGTRPASGGSFVGRQSPPG